MSAFRNYWIGWLLVAVSLACGSAAAIYFEYSKHQFIVAAFLQGAGIALALALAYFFFEQRSHARQQRIDETVRWSIELLRSIAISAVTTTTGSLWNRPDGHDTYGPSSGERVYQEARSLVLERSLELSEYFDDIHIFGSLDWVFRRFELLASHCYQTNRTIGVGLMEYGALIRAMVNLENGVASEKQVWEEFQTNLESRQINLPGEAGYNLLVLAELTVRLVDVLDSENLSGDQEYEVIRRFAPETLYRSNRWR